MANDVFASYASPDRPTADGVWPQLPAAPRTAPQGQHLRLGLDRTLDGDVNIGLGSTFDERLPARWPARDGSGPLPAVAVEVWQPPAVSRPPERVSG